jgi:hypothetical protein
MVEIALETDLMKGVQYLSKLTDHQDHALMHLQQPVMFSVYGKFSFYARVTFLKKSHKSNTKFPFKTMYFLGVGGLITSFCIVYDYASSGHMDL